MTQARNLPLVFQAKLYELQTQEGEDVWLERGVGVPSFVREENLYKLRFFGDDESNPYRYELVVNGSTVFQQNDSKIITWTLVKDSTRESTEMALSFREESGAAQFWSLIDDYIQKEAVHVQVNSRECFVLEYKIPDPTPQNISDILRDFDQMPLQQKRERICSVFLTKRDLLPKLKLLFSELERDRQRNIEPLTDLFSLVKLVLNFSDMELLSELLSDEYYTFTFGCLEYDPQFRNAPPKHRDFLLKQLRFIEVVPIRNRERLRLIHFTYRLEYVKDCVLAHLLDDSGLRLHTIIVLTNYKDTLLNFVFSPKEKDYLNELFGLLRVQEVKAYRLLRDICRVAKLVDLLLVGTPETQRDVVYNVLADKEIYQILVVNIKQLAAMNTAETLQLPPKSRIRNVDELLEVAEISLEFINNSLEVCPKYFKNYCTSERQRILRYPLIQFLLDALLRTNRFVQEHIKLLELLVDNTEPHQIAPIVQSAFLEVFMKAENGFSVLVSVLSKLTENLSSSVTDRLEQLVAKLMQALMHNTRGQKCLKVTILQILRKLLSLYLSEQDFKQKLLDVVRNNVDVMVEELLLSKAHSSLHLSSVLSLLLVIRKSDCIDLLQHICNRLRSSQATTEGGTNVYVERLLQYVQHIIVWQEVAPPILKRDRPSQMALGEEDFESLPDKKLKQS